MELPWSHRRCVLCLRSREDDVQMSRAHLVPRSIGGFAWAWTHCKNCNEEVGARVECDVVNDLSIQFSVEAVQDRLPKLAAVDCAIWQPVRPRRQKGLFSVACDFRAAGPAGP